MINEYSTLEFVSGYEMDDYYEDVTCIGSLNREFIRSDTRELVKCICPYIFPTKIDVLGNNRNSELYLCGCPIHGW